MPLVDLVGEVAHALGDLVADEGEQQRDEAEAEQDDEQGRELARDADAAASSATSGATSAASSSAITSGSTTTRKKLSSHRISAPAPHDDQEAPGPGRREVDAVGHLRRAEVRRPTGDLAARPPSRGAWRAPRPTAGRSGRAAARRTSARAGTPTCPIVRRSAGVGLVAPRQATCQCRRSRGAALREQADGCEHVVAVHDDARVLGQLPSLRRDAGRGRRGCAAPSPGRRAGARHRTRRAAPPRAGPCRCARRPGRRGRRRTRERPTWRRTARVAAAEAISSSSSRSASVVGRKAGSAVRRTAAAGGPRSAAPPRRRPPRCSPRSSASRGRPRRCG